MGQRHTPAAFYLRERPGTYCTGGGVGPRAGLDKLEKSRLHRDSIQPVASGYTDWATVASSYTDWATRPTTLN
jgi:hypothetical protein